MKILFIQHSPSDPPGYMADQVRARGGKYDVCEPILTPLPPDAAGYDGLVILGGPMDADDDAHFPHYQALFGLLDAFQRTGKPVLGLCLGGQLIARHHGAAVRRMAQMELGLARITFLPEAVSDPLLAGEAPCQRLMEWHRDSFDLPDDAVLLAASESCPNQIFRIGALTYACQGHPEATRETVQHWVDSGHENLPPPSRQNLPETEADIKAQWAEARPFADTLLRRWLDLVAASMQKRAGELHA